MSERADDHPHADLVRLEALARMLALPERDDLFAAVAELRHRRAEPALIDLVRQLLVALGDSGHARPESPQQVWDAALEQVRADHAAEWKPEERPAGEHAWRTDGRCGGCGAIASNGPVLSAERCPSKRERRLVTPWEPVLQEPEAT